MKWISIFYLCFFVNLTQADKEQQFQHRHTQVLYDWLFKDPPQYHGDIENLVAILNATQDMGSEFLNLPEVTSAIQNMDQVMERLGSVDFFEDYVSYLKQLGLYFDYGEVARNTAIQYLKQRRQFASRSYTQLEAERAAQVDFNKKYGQANAKIFKKEYSRLENRYLLSEKEESAKTIVLSKKEHDELSLLLKNTMEDLWQKQIASLLNNLEATHPKLKVRFDTPDHHEALPLGVFYKKYAKLFNPWTIFKNPIHFIYSEGSPPRIHTSTRSFFQYYLDFNSNDESFILQKEHIADFIKDYVTTNLNEISNKLPMKIVNPERLFQDFNFKKRLRSFFLAQKDLQESHKKQGHKSTLFRNWAVRQKKYVSNPSFLTKPSNLSVSQKKNSVEWHLGLANNKDFHAGGTSYKNSFFSVTDDFFMNKKIESKILYTLQGSIPKKGTFFSLININTLDGKPVSLKSKTLGQKILRSLKFSNFENDLKVSNTTPFEPLHGIIGLPTPEGYKLKSLSLFHKDIPLEPGKDFKIFHSPTQDAYYVQVFEKSFNSLNTQITFEPARPSSQDLTESKKPLKNLDLKKLSSFIPHLEKIGLKKLAMALEEKITLHEKDKMPFSTKDFSNLISGKSASYPVSLYSQSNFHNANVTSEAEVSLLGDFAKYADEQGRFCTQCDGSNSLLMTLLREYFGKYSDYIVQSRIGFNSPGDSSLNAKDLHQTTLIRHKNQVVEILDATPVIPDKISEIQIISPRDALMTSSSNQKQGDALEHIKYNRDRLTQTWKDLTAFQKTPSPKILQEAMTYSRAAVDFPEGKMSLKELRFEIKRVHPEPQSLSLETLDEIYEVIKNRTSQLRSDLKHLSAQLEEQLIKVPSHQIKSDPLHDAFFLKNLTELLGTTESYFKSTSIEEFSKNSKAPENCSSPLEKTFQDLLHL